MEDGIDNYCGTCSKDMMHCKCAVSSESELSGLLCGFGVWVAGHCPAIPVGPPIAIFLYENHAYEWARNNCNNQYLLKQIGIPFIHFCTSEERKLAEIEGAEMASFFKRLDSADGI